MTAAVVSHRHLPQSHHASISKTPSAFHVISSFSSARKQHISSPCHARQHHSPIRTGAGVQTHQNDRAASFDSISTHEIEPPSASELQSRAKILINALLNNPDLALASTLLASDLHFEHESHYGPVSIASRQAFLSFWKEMHVSPRIEGSETVCRIKEAAVDELQRKVWVVCEIRSGNEVASVAGKEDVVVETVEMLTFDEEGRVCEIQDWRRRVKVRSEIGDD
jgi:hypothetical protein